MSAEPPRPGSRNRPDPDVETDPNGPGDNVAMAEAHYSEIASNLADAIVAALPGWLEGMALRRIAQTGLAPTDDERHKIHSVVTATATTLGERARTAVTADVDAGGVTPLAVLRSGLRSITDVLIALGIAPPPRDEVAAKLFPHDPYELGPASFADIDKTLTGLGVEWGAARAHVHLLRRRERGA